VTAADRSAALAAAQRLAARGKVTIESDATLVSIARALTEAESALANEVLTALAYANDDVVTAQREAGEPVSTPDERLAIICGILNDAYSAWEQS
jgi:hypothetical protein